MTRTVSIDRLQDLLNEQKALRKELLEKNFEGDLLDSLAESVFRRKVEVAKIDGKIEILQDLIIEVLS